MAGGGHEHSLAAAVDRGGDCFGHCKRGRLTLLARACVRAPRVRNDCRYVTRRGEMATADDDGGSRSLISSEQCRGRSRCISDEETQIERTTPFDAARDACSLKPTGAVTLTASTRPATDPLIQGFRALRWRIAPPGRKHL